LTLSDFGTALGFFLYYALFVKGFAHLTAGLNAAKSKKTLQWTDE